MIDLKKLKENLDKGLTDENILKLNEIIHKSDNIDKSKLNNLDDITNKTQTSYKTDNEEFVNLLSQYNKTVELLYKINIEDLSQHEVEVFNNIKNKLV